MNKNKKEMIKHIKLKKISLENKEGHIINKNQQSMKEKLLLLRKKKKSKE